MQSLKLKFRLAIALFCVLASSASAQADDAIRWRKDLEEAKQEAAQQGRLVLLHFYGSACGPCAKLDKEVFSQKRASAALEANYVPVKINVDHSMAIASAYNVTRWPTDVIITPTGQTVAKFISPQGVEGYLSRMDQVAVATKNQAAAGLVNLGPNATNPYSNIATAAGTNAALAANTNPNNFAAPTQYQEAVNGSTVAPQGNTPYGATNPYAQQSPYAQQDPYAQKNPYANSNPYPNQGPAANGPSPGADRYGNAPQGGAADQHAQPPAGPANNYGANAAVDARYNNNPNNNAFNGAAAGNYAQPQQPTHTQQNPYAAPSGPAPSGVPQANFGQTVPPNTAGTQNPYADRYGTNPGYDAQTQTTPGYQANNTPQPSATSNPYSPANDYSQAPSMHGGPSASAGPANSGPPARQQANGDPAFGMDGFCPVALVESQRWLPGDKAWGAVHLGQTYLFLSQANQQKFLADPDKFAPVLAGHDPVMALEQNVHSPGSRSHGVFYRDHIYLFSNETTLAQFGKDPERYANGVRQAMLQMQNSAGGQRR